MLWWIVIGMNGRNKKKNIATNSLPLNNAHTHKWKQKLNVRLCWPSSFSILFSMWRDCWHNIIWCNLHSCTRCPRVRVLALFGHSFGRSLNTHFQMVIMVSFCFNSYLFHRWWIHFCRHKNAADPLHVMSLLLLLWWWCYPNHHWLRRVQSVHFHLCSIFSSCPTFVCSILNFPRSSVRQYPIRRSFCGLSLPFPHVSSNLLRVSLNQAKNRQNNEEKQNKINSKHISIRH